MRFTTSAALCVLVSQVGAFVPSVPSSRHAMSLQMGVLERETGKPSLDPAVVNKYGSLSFPADKILAEYVWVDADGNTRSKTRTLAAEKVSRPGAMSLFFV